MNFGSMSASHLCLWGQATEGVTEFSWSQLPSGIGVFLFVAAVGALLYGVFYVYRREIDTCPRSTKLMLAVLRSLVILTLATIFLGPSITRVTTRLVHPVIPLLRDASQSMNTADRYTESAASETVARLLGKTPGELTEQRPTRSQILTSALARDDQAVIRRLSHRGRVRLIDFATQSNVVHTFPPQKAESETSSSEAKKTESPSLEIPPLAADGRGTDLAGAIRRALESDNPAAIVLATDGQHTGKDDPREAAREAKQRGVPLYIVGLGDASRPRDLRVANVYSRPQTWSEEPFEIEALIVAQGVEGGSAQVELIEKRISETDNTVSAGVVVAQQTIALPTGDGSIPCRFSRSVKAAGKYVYSVRLEPLPEELSPNDNLRDSPVVKVLSREKIRVLLVAGAPTWEFRLVEKLLQREKMMTVSCWLQTLDEGRAQEGTRPITHLPITKEELFWYDVVLLFDPNPREFDNEWMLLLKQFVGDHAGGLLFMAGPKYSGAMLTNPRTAELRNLLPVSFGDLGAMEVASLLSVNSQSWPLRVAAAGVDHPVMSFFADRKQTMQRWETLPGIFWSFPSLEAKPTAQVLLEHSDPTLRLAEGARPLLVAGRYGAGQVLYLGFNGTWRWRKAGMQAEFFDKFWIQAVRHLVEARSLEGRRHGSAQTDRDRYEIGEKVTLTARLQDTSYQPYKAAKVEARVAVEGEAPFPIQLLPLGSQPGSYETAFVPRKAGKHVVMLPIPEATGPESQLEIPFQVELPSAETSQAWLNKPLLVDLAELSGGKYFDLGQLDDLVKAIPDKTELLETRGPPDPLWDEPSVLVFLVTLLGLEWWIRKRNKLL